MTRRCTPALAGLALALTGLVGCHLDGSLDLDAVEAAGDPASPDLFELEDATGKQGGEDGAVDGDVLLPDRVEVYVGEELGIEVRPDVPGTWLQPSSLPEGSRFDEVEDGGFFSWRPAAGDIGSHDVVFLEFDSNGIQMRQRTIIVDVLPRFDLIEYGF